MIIKRIIFDLDNTLINWKQEYSLAAKMALEECNIDLDYLRMNELISQYENKFDRFSIEIMTNFFNILYNQNVKKDFIEVWLKYLGTMSEVNLDLINLLQYLKQKYELVVLTNWFRESQYERLKNAKIAEYFTEVIGGDEFIKPNPNSFLSAIGNVAPHNCLMIGDSYEKDILVAKKLGINVLLISQTPKKGITTIKDVYELKRIL